MYRKNLMRVCLAAIMAATVVTTSVPVYAAETTKMEQPGPGATANVKVKFVDERGNEIKSQELSIEEGVHNYSILKEFLPKEYEMVSGGDFNAVNGTEIEVRVMQKAPEAKTKDVKINFFDEATDKQVAEPTATATYNEEKERYEVSAAEIARKMPEGYTFSGKTKSEYVENGGYVYVSVAPLEKTQSVKINYFDEAAKKQVAEVPVEVSVNTSVVNMAIITRHMPAGYVLSGENGSDCIIRDGYVYVSVAPQEETQTVKINYYDEAAKKQVAEVPVEVSINTSVVNMAIIARYMPAGYVLSGENGSDCIIRDGYVYVSVAPQEETQTVKINYYDEKAEKQVAEVPVEVSINTSVVNKAILARFMPAGYVLVDTDCIIRDGYVYVSVAEDAKEESKVTALRVVYKDEMTQEVVGGETLTGGRQNENGEFVFDAKVDFNIPSGYELAVDYPEITLKEGQTMVTECLVKKAAAFEYVKVTYKDVDGGYVVAYGTAKVEEGAKYFNTSTLTDVPEGYEVAEVGDMPIKDGSAVVTVRKIKEAAPEYVKVTYVDADNGEYVVAYGTVKVEKGATYFNTSTLTDVPEGYEVAEVGDMPIESGAATVKVRKINNVQEVKITYVHKTTGDVVGYGKLNAYKNETYFNTSRVTDVPEGYVIAEVGDMPIENGEATVYVYKATDMEEIGPSTPVEPSKPVDPDPEKPQVDDEDKDKDEDKNKDDKKDKDDKKNPKTSDEASPMTAAATAGLSLAAILALLKKRR